MTYKVMKNKMNDFQYIMWCDVAPSGYKYTRGSRVRQGEPVWIEARRMSSTDEIWVHLYPIVCGEVVGSGELLKRVPAGDIKQGEWDRIYRKVMESI